MGETAIDEDTFNDYLAEMREHYTADKVRACPADSTGPGRLTHDSRSTTY